MPITYDPAKRLRTLSERGLDFEVAAAVFAGMTLTLRDDRRNYGEPRFQTYGLLSQRLVMIVWTPRGVDRHVISMRKCNAREKKNASKRAWVDPDDAPEWTKAQFERAEVAIGGKVVSPAEGTLRRGRPKKADAKVHIHIRLSPQVLGHFRSTGPGWQTRIDEILRGWVKRHSRPSRAQAKRRRAA